jgi:hypothetical protein
MTAAQPLWPHAIIRFCRDEVRQNTERLLTKAGYDGCRSSLSPLRHGVADAGDADASAHSGPRAPIAERN